MNVASSVVACPAIPKGVAAVVVVVAATVAAGAVVGGGKDTVVSVALAI